MNVEQQPIFSERIFAQKYICFRIIEHCVHSKQNVSQRSVQRVSQLKVVSHICLHFLFNISLYILRNGIQRLSHVPLANWFLKWFDSDLFGFRPPQLKVLNRLIIEIFNQTINYLMYTVDCEWCIYLDLFFLLMWFLNKQDGKKKKILGSFIVARKFCKFIIFSLPQELPQNVDLTGSPDCGDYKYICGEIRKDRPNPDFVLVKRYRDSKIGCAKVTCEGRLYPIFLETSLSWSC